MSVTQATGSSQFTTTKINITSEATVADLIATGTAAVTGATTLSSTLTATGATVLQSTLGVSGNANIDGTLDVSGTLGVSGTVTMDSTLLVTGNLTLGPNAIITIPKEAETGMSLVCDANGKAGWKSIVKPNIRVVNADLSGSSYYVTMPLLDISASQQHINVISGTVNIYTAKYDHVYVSDFVSSSYVYDTSASTKEIKVLTAPSNLCNEYFRSTSHRI